jgi:hypothetical protein
MRDQAEGFNEKEVFLRLDQRSQGRIDAEDIKNFMITRGSDCDLAQALSFVSVYDTDKDCCLSIEEFLRAVTPSNLDYSDEYFKFKAVQIQKETSIASRRVSVPYEIEYSMQRFIESEIDFNKVLQRLR